MNQQNTYSIKISPQVIKNDIFNVTYSGGTAPVYSSMTMILSGGTGGTSLLTGLTIPIFLNQSIHDIGYYSEFDGNILQQDVVTNFIYSASSASPYTYQITNTSNSSYKKYLEQSNFTIDWGDSTPLQTFNTFSPSLVSHTYPALSTYYTISMSGNSPWGLMVVLKTIVTPFTGMTIPNPNGTFYFIPNGGNFSGYPTTYDFIFSGDAINIVSAQTSNNYTTIPFNITGTTYSRLNTLSQYGTTKFLPGIQVTGTSNNVGIYYGPDANGVISYIINGVYYYDYPDGTTTYTIQSSGLTSEMLTQVPIVKDEALIGVVMEPEVQSSIFIERGKNTALERIERLGEIDNIGDIEKYGYSFFNVKTYN
jgi:hypothetical protein